jgi:branched-chain amino acid aminotransferase
MMISAHSFLVGLFLVQLIIDSTSFSLRKFSKPAAFKGLRAVGSRNLDWPNLGFEYRDTNCFVEVEYKDGAWGPVKTHTNPYLPIHIGATALHYGQSCFEGLKAFQCQDGSVKVFRGDENVKRIARSCERICMPPIPREKFREAINMVVSQNLDYVPPYGTGGALYIRPLLFGSGPKIGLQPAEEYKFIVLVIPVADYYQGGLQPVAATIISDYDRAAPRGVGSAKVAGNYAADLLPNMRAKREGYPIGLYLDAKTQSFVEEFSTSNFIAIGKDGAYVTPKSEAILASITNKSLMELAKDEGMDVQQRPLPLQELIDGKFSECAACGTAVVVTPVNKIFQGEDCINIIDDPALVGTTTQKLYDRVRGIQNGELEDKFGWMEPIN